jgi:hypothetical protein
MVLEPQGAALDERIEVRAPDADAPSDVERGSWPWSIHYVDFRVIRSRLAMPSSVGQWLDVGSDNAGAFRRKLSAGRHESCGLVLGAL